MTSEPDLVALCADIKLAIPRIDQHSSQTPVLRIQALDQLIDGEVLLKAECLQATGSFKIRGALNAMSAITGQGDINAVVAFSSGNHGIGVAYAARCLGTAATIVLPSDAPQTKSSKSPPWALGLFITIDRMKIGSRLPTPCSSMLQWL